MAWPRRVPYEWILGAMFVATFGLARWMDSWSVRALWLITILPMACRAFGLKREPDAPRPRFGVQLVAAVLGLLYLGGWAAVLEWKHSVSHESLSIALDVLRWATPVTTGLSAVCLIAAAARPARYRELAIFLNAAYLLVIAWGFDNALSARY